MITVVKFKAKHLDLMHDQPGQAWIRPYLRPEALASLEVDRWAFTGLSRGRVVICGGVVEYWKDRGEAWAFIGRDCRDEFLSIHKTAVALLSDCPLRRIEAAVDRDFRAGHRWARALGFELEAPILKHYRPDGGHMSLYAKVRA
jgi:hypothetical protein